MQTYFPFSTGSCFPPLTVVCYDDYDNIISFKSIPEIEIQLTSNVAVLSRLFISILIKINYSLTKANLLLDEIQYLKSNSPATRTREPFLLSQNIINENGSDELVDVCYVLFFCFIFVPYFLSLWGEGG